MKYFGLLSQTYACLKTFWQKKIKLDTKVVQGEIPCGNCFLLNEGAPESSPGYWENAWNTQAADGFSPSEGISLGGWASVYGYFSASATSLKRNQLINVKLVLETVVDAGTVE